MNRMRIRIADRLKDAQNTNAMLTTFNEIDMSAYINMRKDFGEAFLKKHNVKLGFMSGFVKASTLALKEQPVVNAVIDGKQIVLNKKKDSDFDSKANLLVRNLPKELDQKGL